MKKLTYLATMLLVMAGAVSCKKNADVKEPAPQPTGIMRQVTIAAGQAVEKTSVSGGTLTWSEGDKLNIVPTEGEFEAVALEMVSKTEPVATSATFQGSIDSGIADNTPLYGWAGGDWSYNSGTFTIDMPEEQTYVENGLYENAYPSIGTGSIENGISLSNPFGVLRIDVKVELVGSVKSIVLESASKNLAGAFTINPNNGFAVSEGSSKTITLNCENAVALSTDGVTFRIIVPAGEYAADDLTATLKDENGAVLLDATWADVTEVEQGKSTTKFIIGRGTAKRTGGIDVNWVQLWEGGPKFAEYNVGATTVGEYGGYYCWGSDVNELEDCGGYYDGEGDIQGTEYDTAKNLWGTNWQMPTIDNLEVLGSNVFVKTYYYGSSKYKGLNGTLVWGMGDYSGNSVFFPASGYTYQCDGGIIRAGEKGYIWSSTPEDEESAQDLDFDSGSIDTYETWRYAAIPVRAILAE